MWRKRAAGQARRSRPRLSRGVCSHHTERSRTRDRRYAEWRGSFSLRELSSSKPRHVGGPSGGTRSGRPGLFVVSVVLHGLAVVLVWRLAPPPGRPHVDPWAELGEVVIVERLEDVEPRIEVPPDGPSEPAVEPAPELDPELDPEPDPDSDPEDRPDGGSSRSDEPRSSEPDERETPQGPPETDPVGDAPDKDQQAAVPLVGMRTQSRAGDRGSLRPELERTGELAGRPSPVVGPAEAGAAADDDFAPATSTDAAPRSMGEAGFRRRRDGQMVYMGPRRAWRAKLLPDGRVQFRDLVGVPSNAPGVAEAIRAGQGQELYQQEKRKLLKDTFELRLSMAVSWAEAEMERNLDRLYRDLLDVWHEPGRSAAQRRRLLFDRWDECEETLAVDVGEFEEAAGARLTKLRSEAGEKARSKIEDFIVRHLPRGDPDAYSEQELQSLNRERRSRRRFAPYD